MYIHCSRFGNSFSQYSQELPQTSSSTQISLNDHFLFKAVIEKLLDITNLKEVLYCLNTNFCS